MSNINTFPKQIPVDFTSSYENIPVLYEGAPLTSERVADLEIDTYETEVLADQSAATEALAPYDDTYDIMTDSLLAEAESEIVENGNSRYADRTKQKARGKIALNSIGRWQQQER